VRRSAFFPLVTWFLAKAALGQSQTPEAPPTDGNPRVPSAQTDSKSSVKSEEPPEVPDENQKPLPALGAPRPDQQTPLPYLRQPGASVPSDNVELGPLVGVWIRPRTMARCTQPCADGAGIGYGGDVRINLYPWIGARAFVVQTVQPVTASEGSTGLANTTVEQPSLSVTVLGVRAEPTWRVSRYWRLWAGVGAAWSGIRAPAFRTRGDTMVQSSARSGSAVELGGAGGVSFDAIPSWLRLTGAASAAWVVAQGGEVFHGSQAIDQNGRIQEFSGLAPLGGSFALLLGVALVL
jgi:hypothetical protein